ncbi:MAG: single-stranded DNA-binding protein [Planctomycetes bacterium]|nr:single-stranded DNA-binding protein [Planctomycetota bacterium]
MATPTKARARASALERAAKQLNYDLSAYSEADPELGFSYVLNPLEYAWKVHQAFLRRYAPTKPGQVEAVLVGMNPGPWGMAQTGVPFGSPDVVRDFLKITGIKVTEPANVHPKRRIVGLDSPRSEVSGRRLWGGAEECFGTAEAFFERFFVLNYCPLVWQKESGANLTPDKLPKAYMAECNAACDRHLEASLRALGPEVTAIGIGKWAEKQLKKVIEGVGLKNRVGSILHPSPASPIANRGWLPQARVQFEALGHAWPEPKA